MPSNDMINFWVFRAREGEELGYDLFSESRSKRAAKKSRLLPPCAVATFQNVARACALVR
jgi:hypothetical protein